MQDSESMSQDITASILCCAGGGKRNDPR
jgi:hypothetical protein